MVLIVAVAGVLLVAAAVRFAVTRRRRRSRGRADDVPRFTVVALGPQGAGKTLLLASMHHRMQTPGRRGWFVTAPYDEVVVLNKWFTEVADTRADWPYGTAIGETREFTFTVSTRVGVAVRPVLRLAYLEYAGELLTEPQAPGSTGQSELVRRISTAHALLGIIDGHRVRQCLRGEPEGWARLQQALTAMIGPMMVVSSPITFVITKWDLLADLHPDENTRLGIVRNLLMANQGFRDLVRTHSAQRIVRLVPVSAVGPAFAALDPDGRPVKRTDGQLDPTNVELPLSAVVPDVFDQVERSLDTATRHRVHAEARRLTRLRPGQWVSAVAGFVGQTAGTALLAAFAPAGAMVAGNALAGLFLEFQAEPVAADAPDRLDAAEQELLAVQQARRVVLRDLRRRVDVLEGRLPASRLSAASDASDAEW